MELPTDSFHSSLLTQDEMDIIGHLVAAWNIFCNLPAITPNDQTLEFAHGIHRLQDYIAARAVWREEWQDSKE